MVSGMNLPKSKIWLELTVVSNVVVLMLNQPVGEAILAAGAILEAVRS